jgi:ribonuclease P/MRP protein subunit RPP1
LGARVRGLVSDRRILRRLTIQTGANVTFSRACSLVGDALRAYDLVAVQPTTEMSFRAACHDDDVDILSIDITANLPFRLRPALLLDAVTRGVAIELCYAPALRGPGGRRQFVSLGGTLAAATRGGRLLLLSSGAATPQELRCPADVSVLGLLWHPMEPTAARKLLTATPVTILAHAAARVACKSALVVLDTACPVDAGHLSATAALLPGAKAPPATLAAGLEYCIEFSDSEDDLAPPAKRSNA